MPQTDNPAARTPTTEEIDVRGLCERWFQAYNDLLGIDSYATPWNVIEEHRQQVAALSRELGKAAVRTHDVHELFRCADNIQLLVVSGAFDPKSLVRQIQQDYERSDATQSAQPAAVSTSNEAPFPSEEPADHDPAEASLAPPIMAGQIFADLAKNNPDLTRGIRRAQERLRAFGVAAHAIAPTFNISALMEQALSEIHLAVKNNPEIQRLEAERQQLLDELNKLNEADRRKIAEVCERIREGMDSANADLEAIGFTPPGYDLEAWEHLARIVEKDPTSMTLREIYAWARAWIEREKLRLRLASERRACTESQSAATDPRSYSSGLVDNFIIDPTAPMTTKQIACRIWGLHDAKRSIIETAKKRALDWMHKGRLPANKSGTGLYVVSRSALEDLERAERGTSDG